MYVAPQEILARHAVVMRVAHGVNLPYAVIHSDWLLCIGYSVLVRCMNKGMLVQITKRADRGGGSVTWQKQGARARFNAEIALPAGHLVGQAIAFCRLPSSALETQPQTTKTDRPRHLDQHSPRESDEKAVQRKTVAVFFEGGDQH